TLARLRLAPCGDHGGLSAASAKRFFSRPESSRIDSREIFTEAFSDLKTLTISRFYLLSGNPKDTVQVIDAYLKKKPTPEKRSEFVRWLAWGVRDRLVDLMNSGKKHEALGFYHRFSRVLQDAA